MSIFGLGALTLIYSLGMLHCIAGYNCAMGKKYSEAALNFMLMAVQQYFLIFSIIKMT